MKERLKYYVDVKHNVFTVDCENCSYKAGKKYLLEKDILLHHHKVSFGIKFVNTRIIAKMLSIVTSRKNTKY